MVGNIFSESKRLDGEISKLQAIDEERGLPTSQEVNLHYALSRYHNILSQQELFWRQKSRVNLLKAGDSNTAFFH